MIFFSPTPAMLKYIVQRAGKRPVFDIGSGEGHLLRLLIKHKCKALGIEPMWSVLDAFDPRLPVLPMEGQRATVLQPHAGLCIFARPCHSGFVEEVIKVIHPDSEILYISKPINVEEDLPTYSKAKQVHKIPRFTGKSGEYIYEVRRSHGKAKT